LGEPPATQRIGWEEMDESKKRKKRGGGGEPVRRSRLFTDEIGRREVYKFTNREKAKHVDLTHHYIGLGLILQ